MPELPRISLCITTMNRYKDFLSKFLPKFLEYDIFDEVIIVDENGLDKYLLDKNFGTEPKLRLYTNDVRLGAFNNKLKAMSLAKNDWVFLLDSDNFIGPDFIKTLKEFGAANELNTKRIYSPEIALINWRPHPTGNFKHLSEGPLLDKNIIKARCIHSFQSMEFFMNMGNFLVYRPTVLGFDYSPYKTDIDRCKCFDTFMFNYLMTYKNEMEIQIIPGLRFNYAAHEDSYFLPNHKLEEVQEFYRDLLAKIANE